ncbi:MAG: ABC transporter ATP-binding protein [Deltaproteobacteria bacterium]|nr:ABC transporter ATP-binding protein [Deltaproteobacteria bacterium]
MIELQEVYKTYGAKTIIDSLTLRVDEHELMVLLGESGCGKTTTLKMINRLVEPTSGRIRIADQDVRDRDPVELRRGIGYVIQGVGLFPHLSVAENIAIVPGLLGWSAGRIARRVEELLSLVELENLGGRYPAQLSGGQRQRVGVARALAAEPRVMLMDEPFGALDPITRESLQRELRTLHRRLGLTTVLVTHDMMEALVLADRVAVMREGRIVQLDAPRKLLTEPADDYVAELMRGPLGHAEVIDEMMESAGE